MTTSGARPRAPAPVAPVPGKAAQSAAGRIVGASVARAVHRVVDRRVGPVVHRVVVGLVVAGVAVFAVALPGGARAHHAWTEIDTGRTVTLTGTVRALKWENPHASLVLETVDAGNPVQWTVEMSGIARMEARGVDRAAVAVGRPLTIVASPARDGAHVVRANRIQVDGAEYVLY